MAIRRQETLTTLLVVAVIVIAVLNSTVFVARADITRNRIYSFSAATKNMFRSIPQNIRVTYWVSDRLKKISPVPGEIEDILREYAAASHGKVSVRVLDPESEGRQSEAKTLGVYPEQMNIVDQNAQTTASVYSGVVFQYLNRHASIPFIASTRGIEYAFSAKIEQLLKPEKWNVAVLVGNTNRSLAGDYTLVADGLGRFYRVREVEPGSSIDPASRVLIILGGADLTSSDLVPINRYLMGGGNVLFCAAGVRIDTTKDLKASRYGNLPVLDLINNYGVKINRALVLDSHDKHFRTLRQSGGQYVWQDYGPYPHWISVLPSDVSKTNPIMRHFSELDLLWPSPLTPRNLPGIHYDILATTSADAWTMNSHFNTSPVDIPAFSKPADPSLTGQYKLAIAMSGRFPDYFSSGTSPEARIVVVGDDNFVSNLVHYSGSLYNIDFLENAVDWLAGNDGLLAIKTKAQWDPRLDRIGDPHRKMRVYHFAQFVNVVLVPLIVVVFGLRRYATRRRRVTGRTEHGE